MKFIDLFAGVGGFHLTLAQRGAQCVFACEWDKAAADTYERNYGIRPRGDIRAIDALDIPAHDVLCAGFPCQPFSLSGTRGGFNDERGMLIFEVVRIARHHQPRVILLENVLGLLSHEGGATFATIREALREAGYGVHHQIVRGKDVDLPQDHDRLYILCLRADIDVAELPRPLPLPYPTLPYAFVVVDILEHDRDHLIQNGVGFTAPFVKTGEFNGDPDRKQRLGGFGRQCQGARVYDPCGRGVTLCSRNSGASALTGIYLINGRHRTLTARECARMSGFPDTFQPHPHELTAIRQFGNAVLPAAVNFMLDMLEPVKHSSNAPDSLHIERHLSASGNVNADNFYLDAAAASAGSTDLICDKGRHRTSPLGWHPGTGIVRVPAGHHCMIRGTYETQSMPGNGDCQSLVAYLVRRPIGKAIGLRALHVRRHSPGISTPLAEDQGLPYIDRDCAQ